MPESVPPLRLGLVGTGVMGTNHARVARRVDAVDLVAVLDADRTRASTLAAAHDLQVAGDLAALAELVDAVVIATPATTHGELAIAAMRLGLDVLVEKPVAADLDTARRMVDVAESLGRVLMVGHVERFNPAVMELDHLVRDVSDVLHVEARRISSYSPRILDDVVVDLMIHDLDIVAMLAGSDATAVHGVGTTSRSSSTDVASAVVEFASGLTAAFTASRVGQNKIRQIDITQRENFVTLDLLRQDVTVQRVDESEFMSDRGQRYRQVGTTEVPFLDRRGEPLALELEDFARAVRTRGAPRVDGHDGVRALDLALRVSHAIGRR